MTFYVLAGGAWSAFGVIDNSAYACMFTGVYVQETGGAFLPPPNPGNSGNGNGKKGNPPGQEKKADAYLAKVAFHRAFRKRRDHSLDSLPFIPAEYLSPGARGRSLTTASDRDVRERIRTITISPAGHTVRNR